MLQAPPPWLIGWIALIASAASLSIAAATFVITHRRPRIRMVLPLRVRLSVEPTTGTAWLYMQPIFVNVGRSTRADVIDDVRVELSRDGASALHLEYVEKSKTTWDAVRREVHVEYQDEAAPIIVAQNSVRSDMLTFKEAVSTFEFQPGNYTGVLTAKLIGSNVVLRAAFSFNLMERHVSVWNESSGRRFAMLPIRRA